jgi:hypothetical protein
VFRWISTAERRYESGCAVCAAWSGFRQKIDRKKTPEVSEVLLLLLLMRSQPCFSLMFPEGTKILMLAVLTLRH